ncbi:hypothetical protein MAXJ12_11717 [Mesorhizobium alhagi CCNWXJ12-2]|uniref:Uncharacterized protein n=1 Tax=Mesorhizobium alhagi CCNWXJ12-2 TaxID=1107882 RepID=H0HQB3_9HYPH|nr:hypothetical protein MAXJ12_11717 [Mesorhizobium alhagi CCNWXJ12-2]
MKNKEKQYGNLNDEQFEQYLSLIKRMYERMEAENSWPWVVDPKKGEQFQGK